MRGWIAFGALVGFAAGAFGCGARTELAAPLPEGSDAGVDAGIDAGVDAGLPPIDPQLEPAIQVVAGLFHTCAATRRGRVHCWGFNNQGQLGNGSVQVQHSPVASPSIDDAIAVTAGRTHSCALRATGVVLCWGDNLRGQLGDGDDEQTRQALPVPVVGLGDVAQVDAGGEHTCARQTGGRVFCWGNGQDDQLGLERMSSRAPIPVDLPEPARAVSAGWRHTCALLESGRVVCWGRAATTVNNPSSDPDGAYQRREVRGLPADVASITSGDLETCAVSAAGALYCWDFGIGGRPNLARQVADGGVVEASCGHEFRCFRRASGEVRCMGNNERGQLGDRGQDQTPGAEVAPQGLPPADLVTAGWRHACALDASGVVRCWGRNQEGELGDGTSSEYRPPVIAAVVRD